jgi:hypothetical protein
MIVPTINNNRDERRVRRLKRVEEGWKEIGEKRKGRVAWNAWPYLHAVRIFRRASWQQGSRPTQYTVPFFAHPRSRINHREMWVRSTIVLHCLSPLFSSHLYKAFLFVSIIALLTQHNP